MAALTFELNGTCPVSAARAGTITTDHGVIPTPVFMPVGTVGSVKAVSQQQLKQEVGASIILGNTYHLYLRPGLEVLEAAGGLHKFIGWDRPILTDSGGYQVFSLAGTRKIQEEGVVFQSHIDGSRHLFSPEKVMDIQRTIGGDIIMAFDECPPYPSDHAYAEKSMHLTHRWLDRCLAHFGGTDGKYGYTQNLFPIVQGGVFPDLRKTSCAYISEKGAVGNAIGGLSVGEPEQQLYDICAACCEALPADRPRYLMGVGTPWNLLECISRGVDMFDCVMPTRNGRNAMLFTSRGVINIDNKKWEKDFSPLDEGMDSGTYGVGGFGELGGISGSGALSGMSGLVGMSQFYSKAYLRHLIKSKEILGLTIASVHNLAFYLHLVREARKHILQGDFISWKREQMDILPTRL